MQQDGLGSLGGWLPLLGAVPSSQARRGRECCCVNPCLPSARLAVNGAGLMGLVRGLQLMCAVHAAPRGAACQDYQEPWRWQSRVCALMAGGMVKRGFLLRASLAALTSLLEFTPGIKHFGFTFSLNTSSSSRVVCYTFNCSSFEFSSPCLVPLQHQYLVILLLLLIANTCQLFQRRKLWHWAWGRGRSQRRFTCMGKPSEN